MDFALSEEQAMFQDSVGRFARATLAAKALERAHSDAFPWDVARQLAAQGLLGITIPVEDGGHGGSLLDAVIAIEQVALACPKSADLVQAGNFGAIRTFAAYATPAQKGKYLPALLKGEAVISVAMTEPDAGSAVTELATRATRDGAGYRISGSKIFTTNSTEAALFLVYVRFGPGVSGIGSVLVERDAPGLTLGPASRFMNGESWQPLYFDGCFVPDENVLLPAGGFKRQIQGFNVERIGNAARSLRGRPLRLHSRARARADAPPVRARALRVPGHPVEVRRDRDEARCGAALALSRRGQRRRRPAVGLRDRNCHRPSATAPATRSPTRRCR